MGLGTGFLFVRQAGLELTVLITGRDFLELASQWEYRHVPPSPDFFLLVVLFLLSTLNILKLSSFYPIITIKAVHLCPFGQLGPHHT